MIYSCVCGIIENYCKYFIMVICNCFNVNEIDIENAIKDGCISIEDIKSHTNAARGCGICELEIFKYLNKTSATDM